MDEKRINNPGASKFSFVSFESRCSGIFDDVEGCVCVAVNVLKLGDYGFLGYSNSDDACECFGIFDEF